MVMRNIDRAAGHLTESADAELQMIAGPDLFLDRQHFAESPRYAGEAGFQAPDRFLLPQSMGDGHNNWFRHRRFLMSAAEFNGGPRARNVRASAANCDG